MNINDLKPASHFAKQFGVRAILYGPPGTGKTPLSTTAPSPVICFTEPGMLTLRSVDDIPAFDALTPNRMEEFFTWLFQSKEASQFDTVIIDSISQLCESFLKQELARNKDGRRAYGEMSRRAYDLIEGMYNMRDKHIWLIAKQTMADEAGVMKKRPYFPGQELNTKVPHLYDAILHISPTPMPSRPQQFHIRTTASYDTLARDRSGKLDEFEQPNITNIINKIMT